MPASRNTSWKENPVRADTTPANTLRNTSDAPTSSGVAKKSSQRVARENKQIACQVHGWRPENNECCASDRLWQLESKAGTALELRMHLHCTAVQLQDALDDGQAQA